MSSMKKVMALPGEIELPAELVSAKARCLSDIDARRLIHFLHGMVLRLEGVRPVAKALIADYPEGFLSKWSPSYHSFRSYGNGFGDGWIADDTDDLLGEEDSSESVEEVENSQGQQTNLRSVEFYVRVIEGVTSDLHLYVPGEAGEPRGRDGDYRGNAGIGRFESMEELDDFTWALLYDWMDRRSIAARDRIADTEVKQLVDRQLSACLRLRRMIVLEGREGIGKTESVRAWCDAHLDRVRYVSVSGMANRSNVLRAIANAVGVVGGNARNVSPELQPRVEAALRQSKLMLVIDEAHFLASLGETGRKKPRLIDWINTGLCNNGVPVALVATDQFRKQLSVSGKVAGYNSRQFKRRCIRYERLPDHVSLGDLRKVARKLAPWISKDGVQALAGYASDNYQPLSVMRYAVEEAEMIAEGAGRDRFTDGDLIEAIEQYRIPSDERLAEIEEINDRPARAMPKKRPGTQSATSDPDRCSDDSTTLQAPRKRGGLRPDSKTPRSGTRQTTPDLDTVEA